MMENVFLKLINMSITASYLILAVFLVRAILKKAPRKYIMILWALVGLRLLLPFSIESGISLIPCTNTVPNDILYSQNPTVNTGIPTVNNIINPIISDSMAPDASASANPMQILSGVATYIWLIGIAGVLVYTFISYVRIYKATRESIEITKGIYVCDRIDTPFIFGVIHPFIYLPSTVKKTDSEYVIAHERSHIKRLDNIWKALGFILMTVYWFNPLVVLSYIFMCRDMEAACDERVIYELGERAKKPYAEALVNCSSKSRIISMCPLAFGEISVKSRIKNVLSYKKPTLWIIIVTIVLIIGIALGFMLDPFGMGENEALTLYNSYTKSVLVSHMPNEDSFSALDKIYMSDSYRIYTGDENGNKKLIGKMKKSDIKDVPSIGELNGGYCIAAWKIPKNEHSLEYLVLMNENDILAIYSDSAGEYRIYDMSPDLYSGTHNKKTSRADFFGIVVKVEEDHIVVCPGVGEGVGGFDEYIQLGRLIKVSTELKSEKEAPILHVGDQVDIVYDGNPVEGDIPYINNVYNILIKKAK